MAVMLLESIGQRVARLRQLAGISQGELGRRAGVHYSYISRLEAGQIKAPNGDVLGRIAACLNVSTDYILQGEAALTPENVPPDLQPMLADIKLVRATNPEAAASMERLLRHIIDDEKRRQGLQDTAREETA